MYIDGAESSPRKIAYDIFKMLRRSHHTIHAISNPRRLSRRPSRVAPLMPLSKIDKAVQVQLTDVETGKSSFVSKLRHPVYKCWSMLALAVLQHRIASLKYM